MKPNTTRKFLLPHPQLSSSQDKTEQAESCYLTSSPPPGEFFCLPSKAPLNRTGSGTRKALSHRHAVQAAQNGDGREADRGLRWWVIW